MYCQVQLEVVGALEARGHVRGAGRCTTDASNAETTAVVNGSRGLLVSAVQHMCTKCTTLQVVPAAPLAHEGLGTPE